MTKQMLIVGGGLTGLTAAYKLSASPEYSVTLVEASDQVGGLAGGFPLLGTSLEKTYHHLFLSDTSILDLVAELGLNDKLMWCESSLAIYRDGRTHPFMSPRDLLSFKPCSLIGRVRMGLTALYLQRRKNWRALAAHTAHDWMTRACGRSAMDSVWTPLLKGKFDRHYDKVSMAWLWARIHVRANSRAPGGAREKLAYFRGGFAELIRKLESELSRRNVRVETGVRLEALTAKRSAVVNGRTVPFDSCIFTGPSPALAGLLPAEGGLEDYARQLRSIQYLGAICLVFVSDQNLGDYYWVNVNEPDARFLVFINHTRLVDPSFYQGKHVYYIGAYLPVDGPVFGLTDDGLAESWWGYLKQMFPEFDAARVSERHIFRFKAAQHIVDPDYEKRIPSYQTPLPGVYLANFSQIFPEDRGTNYAVREGVKIAALVREQDQLVSRR